MTTGDQITPGAIEYPYPMLLENRKIQICSYNLETILAEKMDAIISRDITNTRMRDFYDIYILLKLNSESLDIDDFIAAFT